MAAKDNIEKSSILAATPRDVDLTTPQVYSEPGAMRQRAAEMLKSIPFPAGRNSAVGYTWTGIEGGVSDPDIRDLLQYRASCDWFREAVAHDTVGDEARAILPQIPEWLVFRDAPYRAVVEELIAQVLAGDLEPMRAHVDRVCVDLRKPAAP